MLVSDWCGYMGKVGGIPRIFLFSFQPLHCFGSLIILCTFLFRLFLRCFLVVFFRCSLQDDPLFLHFCALVGYGSHWSGAFFHVLRWENPSVPEPPPIRQEEGTRRGYLFWWACPARFGARVALVLSWFSCLSRGFGLFYLYLYFGSFSYPILT